jgi:Tho complex subunit 7
MQRVIKRLITSDSLLFKAPGLDDDATAENANEERNNWREEMLLEFFNLEATMVRIQLLRQSNERERERYAVEKLKILETAQTVRSNIEKLRVQLVEAQKNLALRKTYDELAEKITSNRMLRPREDQHAQLEKLSGEIADLEEESREYKRTWAERREQFGRIVEEGRQMLRMIKDEKEEAERKEGMEGGEDYRDSSSARGQISAVGSPRFDGENTPMRQADGHDQNDRLALPLSHLRAPSPAKSGSRAYSPWKTDADKDVEMGEVADTPARTNVTSEMEEGEAEEDDTESMEIS